MSSHEFVQAFCCQLRVPKLSFTTLCPAYNSNLLDTVGDYAILSGNNGETIKRHNAIIGKVFQTCASTSLTLRLDTSSLVPKDQET